MDIIGKLYKPSMMVKKAEQMGPMPSAREAMGLVLKMAWPAIFQGIVLHLCGMVDTMMVGEVGTEAITAVGISGVPRQLITAFYSALTVSASTIIARRIGEGKPKGANDTLKQISLYCLILSVVLCTAGFFFAPHLMLLCGSPKSILPDAVAYFRIWLMGVPLFGVSSVFTAAFSAAGKPKVTMVASITSNLVNIIFNYLLIGGRFGFPALGVQGAAVATSLCYIVSFFIALGYSMQRKSVLRPEFSNGLRFDKAIFRLVMMIAPAQLLSGLMWFVSATIQSRIINSLGSDTSFAAYQIILSLYGIFISVAGGFSTAAGILIGQSLGKRRPDISKVYIRLCVLLSCLFSLVFVVFFAFFDEFTIGLYVRDPLADADTFKAALIMLRILVLSTPATVLLQVFWGALQGAGDVKFTSAMMLFSLVCRTVCFYIFCNIPAIGVVGTLLGILTDDLCRTILCYLRYRGGRWKEIKL